MLEHEEQRRMVIVNSHRVSTQGEDEEHMGDNDWQGTGDRGNMIKNTKQHSYMMYMDGMNLMSYYDLHQRLLRDKDELALKYQ